MSILFAAGIIQVPGASSVAKMRAPSLRLALLLAGAGIIDGERSCGQYNASRIFAC